MRANFSTKKIWIVASLTLICLMAIMSASEARIDATQRQQLKSVAMETRDATRQKRDALRRARTELFEIYGNFNLDEHKAKTAIEKIGKLQLDLLNQHLSNQIKIRSILNEDQFSDFVQMMKNRMNQGRPGQPAFGMHEESPGEMSPNKEMLSNIGVSKEQLKRLSGQREQKKRAVLEKLRNDSKQLIDIYSQYNLDKTTANKLITNIHNYQLELSSINFKRQQAIRSVLTRDQFQQLQTKLSERMKNNRRPWMDR